MVKILDKSVLKDVREPKKTKLMTALAKSKHGTAWAVIRDPATARILICRRSPTSNNAGQWGFPGGGVDEGESHKVACRRETIEEIGVTLPLSSFIEVIASDKDTTTIWFEVYSKVRGKKTEEVDMFAWVLPHELDGYHLHKSVRQYFKTLLSYAKEVHSKGNE